MRSIIAPVIIIPLSLCDWVAAALRFFGAANEESRSRTCGGFVVFFNCLSFESNEIFLLRFSKHFFFFKEGPQFIKKGVLDSFFIRIFKILYTHKHIHVCKYKYDILIDDTYRWWVWDLVSNWLTHWINHTHEIRFTCLGITVHTKFQINIYEYIYI